MSLRSEKKLLKIRRISRTWENHDKSESVPQKNKLQTGYYCTIDSYQPLLNLSCLQQVNFGAKHRKIFTAEMAADMQLQTDW